VHISATWLIQPNHLYVAAMRPYVKLLWPLVTVLWWPWPVFKIMLPVDSPPSSPHHNHFAAIFFRDHPGEPVPEENFWTLWCMGRQTEAYTPTMRAGRHSVRTKQCPPPPSPRTCGLSGKYSVTSALKILQHWVIYLFKKSLFKNWATQPLKIVEKYLFTCK